LPDGVAQGLSSIHGGLRSEGPTKRDSGSRIKIFGKPYLVSLDVDHVIAEPIDDRLCPDIKNSRFPVRFIGKPLGKSSEFLSHFGSQWTVTE
jgi:hypothetical protein